MKKTQVCCLEYETNQLNDTEFELNISKMGSWNHMGHTGNMIVKDLSQMCIPLENSVYFGDGHGFNSNPDGSMNRKLMNKVLPNGMYSKCELFL